MSSLVSLAFNQGHEIVPELTAFYDLAVQAAQLHQSVPLGAQVQVTGNRSPF